MIKSTTKQIEQPVLAVLSGLEINGNQVKITEQLERKLYIRVNEVLVALGGTWQKKAKAHVFESDPTEVIDDAIMMRTFERQTGVALDFYPTPPELVQKIIQLAGLEPWMTVLEPSAGQGNIADAAAAIVGPSHVTAIDINEVHARTLQAKGYIAGRVGNRNMTILEQVIARMEARGFQVTATKQIESGWQVRFGERIVNVYSTGRVLVQGKWAAHTRDILGIISNHKGRLPERGSRKGFVR